MFEDVVTQCKGFNETPRMAVIAYLWLKFIDIVGREPDLEEINEDFKEWQDKYGDYNDYENLESLFNIL